MLLPNLPFEDALSKSSSKASCNDAPGHIETPKRTQYQVCGYFLAWKNLEIHTWQVFIDDPSP